jgi:hypothetical protein
MAPSEACLAAAIAIEQMQHLIRRKLCGVSGFQLSQLLSAWVDPQRSDLSGMAALQSSKHPPVLIAPADRAAGALLHAVRRFMGEGVPDLSGVAMVATDHERVAAGVIQTLQTALRAVTLHDSHSCAAQTGAQSIDRWPGAGLNRRASSQGYDAEKRCAQTTQKRGSHPVFTEDNSTVNPSRSKRITQKGERDEQM